MLIKSLYGLPTRKQSTEHNKRLQAAIDYLGEKYILASSIKKNMTKE
jgi:hypothetical protein